jgi:hypothetical protein
MTTLLLLSQLLIRKTGCGALFFVAGDVDVDEIRLVLRPRVQTNFRRRKSLRRKFFECRRSRFLSMVLEEHRLTLE